MKQIRKCEIASDKGKSKYCFVRLVSVCVCIQICVHSGQQVKMNFVCHNILRNTFLIGLTGSVLMPASTLLDTLGARVEDTEQKLSLSS